MQVGWILRNGTSPEAENASTPIPFLEYVLSKGFIKEPCPQFPFSLERFLSQGRAGVLCLLLLSTKILGVCHHTHVTHHFLK